jgi:hypothetical protein
MLTADLRHALLAATRDAGYPVPGPDPVLRPGGAPGRYTSALPLRIAPRNPAPVAEAIAARLAARPWIEDAHPTPQGYLEITVTADALERLAVRIAQAGPRCARSDALAATGVARPPGTAPGPTHTIRS